jgi:hypothetical protein
LQRSEEISKGIQQVKHIMNLWESKSCHAILNKFSIDDSYECIGAVASVCFIGAYFVQDPDVPVVNIWHLVRKINECNDLKSVIDWLKAREYLPVENVDFSVLPISEKFGEWTGNWYGIKAGS